MPTPLHLMLKPASGRCNLRCRYCFYADLMHRQDEPACTQMSVETLEAVVEKALREPHSEVTFAFQGGEPTLSGLEFYKTLIELQKKHNRHNAPIQNALQTNGLLLDEAWARFLRENRFLVGLSLDGPAEIHDLHRVDAAGNGSFSRTVQAAKLLKREHVDFNLLTVVTAKAARSARSLYAFFKRNGFAFQQYLPCMDGLDAAHGDAPYSLTAPLYGRFLCQLFDLWEADVRAGQAPSIRYFENLLSLLLGQMPEACGMLGVCQRQLVVEADGSVYPCDFYVLPELRLGNLNTDELTAIEKKRDETGFLLPSRVPHPDCLSCPYVPLCRGGCRRDREPMEAGRLSKNIYCDAYKTFFSHCLPRLERLAAMLRNEM